MSYEITAATLVHRVCHELGEPVRNNARLPLREVLAWLNEGERTLARRTLCLRGTHDEDLDVNNQAYGLDIEDIIDDSVFLIEVRDVADGWYRSIPYKPYIEVLDDPNLLAFGMHEGAPMWWTIDHLGSQIIIGPAPPASVTDGLRIHYAQEPTPMRNYIYDAAGSIASIVTVEDPPGTFTSTVTGIGTTWDAQGAFASAVTPSDNDRFGTISGADEDETLPNAWTTITTVIDDTSIILTDTEDYVSPSASGSKYLISSLCRTATLYSDMADVLVNYAKAQAVKRIGRHEESQMFIDVFNQGIATLHAQIAHYPLHAREAQQPSPPATD